MTERRPTEGGRVFQRATQRPVVKRTTWESLGCLGLVFLICVTILLYKIIDVSYG